MSAPMLPRVMDGICRWCDQPADRGLCTVCEKCGAHARWSVCDRDGDDETVVGLVCNSDLAPFLNTHRWESDTVAVYDLGQGVPS